MSAWSLAALSAVWFALASQWTTVVPTLVPDQIEAILGAHHPAKEGITGSILAAGSLVALLVSPLAGALSDRSQHRTGRRRSFLMWGMLGTCASLLLLIAFGPGASLVLYAAAFLLLQFCWNWVAGPYAGLIPDVVPAAQQSEASGWLNIMTVGGTAVGNAAMGLLYSRERPGAVIFVFIAINLAAIVLTLRYVREPPPARRPPPFDMRTFLRSFYLDPKAHPAFYQVLLTRLLANMGIWPVFAFLLFYFGDVIGVQEPAKVVPLLLGLGAIAAVPASLLAIRLSRRMGLVGVTQAANWIMAACACLFVLIALRPSFVLILPVLLVFAGSYGAYQAADWALALRVLPDAEFAGKDMGVWHISLVLPQVLGPAATGWMISWVRGWAGGAAAYTAAFGVAAAWLVLAAVLLGRIRLPPPSS